MSDLTKLGGSDTTPPEEPRASSGGSESRAARRGGLAALCVVASSALLLLLFVVHIAGRITHPLPGRLALVLVVISAVAWLWTVTRGAWRTSPALLLLGAGLLLLALTVRLSGVTHELVEQSYLDEGTYLRHATEIAEGSWVRGSFVYPHLLYNLGAAGIWSAELLEPLSSALTGQLVDLPSDSSQSASSEEVTFARNRLVLRLIVALLSAAAVLPIAFVGYRLAGPLVGLLAGVLWTLSPLVNEGAHLVIADWPSAAFVALCLAFVTHWYEQPPSASGTWAIALLAGCSAGLAAATKYPAGVVAVAIVAVAVARWWTAPRNAGSGDRTREIGWFAAAGFSALGTFLLCSPTFFVDPQHALFSPRGMLFGFRQYAGGGWLGVQPDSNLLFYLAQLARDFGTPLLALAAIGLALLLARPSPTRRRLLLTSVFPLIYVLLIGSMSMVVKRNLAPAMPAICVLVAVGLFVVLARAVAWSQRFEWARRRLPRALAIGAALLLVSLPLLIGIVTQSVGLARDSTREQASKLLERTLPPGVRLFRESYTPRLRNLAGAEVLNARFLARRPQAELLSGEYDYLLAASSAYGRFFRQQEHFEEHHESMFATYEALFARLPTVLELEPSRWRQGPTLRLLAVTTAEWPSHVAGSELLEHASLPDGAMHADNEIVFDKPGQWALIRLDIADPSHRLFVRGGIAAASSALRVVSLADPKPLTELEPIPLIEESAGLLASEQPLGCSGPTLVYLFLPQGSRVNSIEVSAATPAPSPDPPRLPAAGS